MDNFYTGRRNNVLHWIGHPNFELIHHDITVPLFIEGSHLHLHKHLLFVSISDYELMMTRTLVYEYCNATRCDACSERGVPLGVACVAAALHGEPDQDAQGEPARHHQYARARAAPERALPVRLDFRGALSFPLISPPSSARHFRLLIRLRSLCAILIFTSTYKYTLSTYIHTE